MLRPTFVVAAGLGLAATATLVAHAGIKVEKLTEEFCLTAPVDGRCPQRLADGAKIALKDLPADEAGQRHLYFHSSGKVGKGALVFHVWEKEGGPAASPRFVDKTALAGVAPMAKAIVKLQDVTLGDGANRLIVALSAGPETARLGAVSERQVARPGVYRAALVGAEGEMLGVGRKIEIVE